MQHTLQNSSPKSSNKNDIIDWLLKLQFIQNYVNKLAYGSENTKDYIQEICLYMCEIDQSKWDDIYKQGKFSIIAYTSGIIYRQLKSKNSPIYAKYKKRQNFEERMSDNEWNIFTDTNLIPKNNNIY